MIRTRAGYLASWAGIGVIGVGLAGLFAFDLFGTFFGVLVMASLFFAGITLPYIIDSVAFGLQERRGRNETPDN
ncbi:MAG: hypothetical protein JW909_05560 [Planctomycetes bacterium]|nr:hypothetical protein [Planctomycetota bacterium]